MYIVTGSVLYLHGILDTRYKIQETLFNVGLYT